MEGRGAKNVMEEEAGKEESKADLNREDVLCGLQDCWH